MGFVKTVLIFLLTLGAAYVTYVVHDFLADHPTPHIEDEFWGPGSKPGVIPENEDATIKPFKVDFTSSLKDLKSRLKLELDSNRFATPLEGVGFGYGFNTIYLKKVLTYWMEKYDFAKREKWLNRHPHFKTKIGGLDIHFQHIKPTKTGNYKKTVPIIFIHGWPGSFVEYQKLIDYFLEPKNSEINFEIVIPSLPGFGFSQAASRPGMIPVRIANILGRLMKRLGYDKYYTLGEDWGSMISTDMGILYPDRVEGVHCTCYSLHPRHLLIQSIAGIFYPSSIFKTERSKSRFYPMSKMLSSSLRESGYIHLQATKPDTVGVGLTQSPSGLAAYILEKFSTWTNESFMDQDDGGLEHKFTMDELLDNVMVYWVSKSITSSMRLYLENFTGFHTMKVPVLVPVGCVWFPEDLVLFSEIGIRAKFHKLEQFTMAEEGGHFASYEVPHIVGKEAIKFFNNVDLGYKKVEL